MTLINRVSRLFRADLHAVLDRVEEPDLVLRQAVREMEVDLGRDHRRADRLGEQRRDLDQRLAEIEAALAGIGEELDLCLASGADDLARTLVRRRLESERHRVQLQRQCTDSERALGRLHQRIAGNTSRLEAMRRKAALLAGDQTGTRTEVPTDAAIQPVTEQDVEIALLRERQRREAL